MDLGGRRIFNADSPAKYDANPAVAKKIICQAAVATSLFDL